MAFFADTNTATAWKRQVDGQTLTFTRAEQPDEHGQFLLQDSETGSLWSAMTGTAVTGTLQGQQLEQLTHYPILTKRFHAFYPEGVVFP